MDGCILPINLVLSKRVPCSRLSAQKQSTAAIGRITMIAPSTTSCLERPVTQSMARSPFLGDPQHNGTHRNIPILPSSTKPIEPSHGEPMEITPPASVAMGPPIHSSPEMDHSGGITNGTYVDSAHQNGSMTNGLSAAAATSSQQPKVVQTAFIHKLYKYVFFFWQIVRGFVRLMSVSACWKIPAYRT